VAPKVLDFRRAGLLAAVLALAVMPWHLYGSPVAVNYFLGALGAFMGPLFGILMVDCWLIRRERVAIDELYKIDGAYAYSSGVNPRAMIAFVVASTPTAILALVPTFGAIAPFSWPIGWSWPVQFTAR
jgi:NCS1 family nucleobase:cation symporter-1